MILITQTVRTDTAAHAAQRTAASSAQRRNPPRGALAALHCRCSGCSSLASLSSRCSVPSAWLLPPLLPSPSPAAPLLLLPCAPLPSRLSLPPFPQIAADIRYILNAYDKVIPTVLEIPSKDKPYHEEQDPIMQRVLKLMGSRD